VGGGGGGGGGGRDECCLVRQEGRPQFRHARQTQANNEGTGTQLPSFIFKKG